MPGFDGELSELTPQKREERERQEQKKREQDILLPKKKTGWEIIFFSVWYGWQWLLCWCFQCFMEESRL